jgi:EAL domain-containing protein (putative c-di-GMP-specific phosphodiesterase class I)
MARQGLGDGEGGGHGAGRILLVDDDPALLGVLRRALADVGHEVVTASDGREALRLLETPESFDAVVSDITMPHMSGIDLLRAVRERDLDLPVLLITGAPDVATAIEAVEWGAYKYIAKPPDIAVLRQNVRRAVALRRMAGAKREAGGLLGHGAGVATDRAGMEATFSRALQSLWVAFQPIVQVERRSVFGYEALLRTSEPTLPHPAAVLDVAERLNRLHDLGRAVRNKAAEVVPSMGTGCLFVNLHPKDLNDSALYDPDAPLSRVARSVILEITERASLDEVPGVHDLMGRLRSMGFRLALDDLGAGYAGLTSFATIEPDVVKIDTSLVRDLHLSAVKRKVVEKITSLAQDLDILVVAEGVETAAERVVLTSIGCDLMQGYLFAKPERSFPQVSW